MITTDVGRFPNSPSLQSAHPPLGSVFCLLRNPLFYQGALWSSRTEEQRRALRPARTLNPCTPRAHHLDHRLVRDFSGARCCWGGSSLPTPPEPCCPPGAGMLHPWESLPRIRLSPVVRDKVLVASSCASSFVTEQLRSAPGPFSLWRGLVGSSEVRVARVSTQVSERLVGAQGGARQSPEGARRWEASRETSNRRGA